MSALLRDLRMTVRLLHSITSDCKAFRQLLPA